MGWYVGSSTVTCSSLVKFAVAGLFVVQNVLGGIACISVLRGLTRESKLATDLLAYIGSPLDSSTSLGQYGSMPVDVYRTTITLTTCTLGVLVTVWVALPWLVQ